MLKVTQINLRKKIVKIHDNIKVEQFILPSAQLVCPLFFHNFYAKRHIILEKLTHKFQLKLYEVTRQSVYVLILWEINVCACRVDSEQILFITQLYIYFCAGNIFVQLECGNSVSWTLCV